MRKSLAAFYAKDMYQLDRTRDSARVVVPMIVALTRPESVVDVGCGLGAWLGEFHDRGIKVIGLDGDYLEPSTLRFPSEFFRPVDLSSKFEIPAGQYDLAVCLEVAEHLPPANSRHLVQQLTSASPCVLFSAAPPGQWAGGHINCQPLSFWRKLFEEFGFRMFDPVRPGIRDNRDVAWWYRQNIVLFASQKKIDNIPMLAQYEEVPPGLETEWVYAWVAEARGPAAWGASA